jgi:hypothetical protein
MTKRDMVGSRPSRKRRKGGISYGTIDLDAPDGDPPETEAIRVWNISTSETTGRASATRKNYKHVYGNSQKPVCEEPLTVEHSDAPADPESNDPLPAKSAVKLKRKRVRTMKENDSVSHTLTR